MSDNETVTEAPIKRRSAAQRSHGTKTGKRADPRKSRQAKQRFRLNKNKYARAMKAFNRSAKGKQMHRKLGRFNAMHASAPETVGSMIEAVMGGADPSLVARGLFESPEAAAYDSWDKMMRGWDEAVEHLASAFSHSHDPLLLDLIATVKASREEVMAHREAGTSPEPDDMAHLKEVMDLIKGRGDVDDVSESAAWPPGSEPVDGDFEEGQRVFIRPGYGRGAKKGVVIERQPSSVPIFLVKAGGKTLSLHGSDLSHTKDGFPF